MHRAALLLLPLPLPYTSAASACPSALLPLSRVQSRDGSLPGVPPSSPCSKVPGVGRVTQQTLDAFGMRTGGGLLKHRGLLSVRARGRGRRVQGWEALTGTKGDATQWRIAVC